jgi:hypothetical protein
MVMLVKREEASIVLLLPCNVKEYLRNSPHQ